MLFNQNTNNDVPIVQQINQTKLILIKHSCDRTHKHCAEIIANAKKLTVPITQEYFDNFLLMISRTRYYECISNYYNSKYMDVKKFILEHSKLLKVNYWDTIITYMTDNEIYEIMIKQQILVSDLITKLINIDITTYVGKKNLMKSLIENPVKVKTFEYIIMSMSLENFSKYLDKIDCKINLNNSVESIINKFILANKECFGQKKYIQLGIKILHMFITKPNILANIYPLISSNINLEQKKNIFNKCISTCNKNLMLEMLEKKDIILDINCIDKLVEKSYARTFEGAPNNKQVAEIVDLLCEYGLIITKDIVIKLLEHGCYVNNLEKHGLIVDDVILNKCSNLSYYPYKFDIVPNIDILKKECTKHDNLNTIKKLKEFGSKYTTECLEEACKIAKNGKVIKYLINECGVKVSDVCLVNFQDVYKIDALDAIMKKYKENSIKNSNSEQDMKSNIEINEKSTMVVTPRNIYTNIENINDVKIDIKNDTIEYELKNKVRKFFDYKKKTIKYNELYEMFLKYLILNKLIIGKYFVISIELSNLLKINHCVIINTNQINNILTYFIDLPNINPTTN